MKLNIPADADTPCRDNPEEWFAEADEHLTADAKEACGWCAFRDPCLAYAIANSVVGVWGGTTTEERRAVRDRTGIVAATDRHPAARSGPGRIVTRNVAHRSPS